VETAAKKELFIEALATGRSPGCVATVLDIARPTAYAWKKDDADFSQRWDNAVETALDKIETKAYDMALEGHWPAVEWNLKWRRRDKYQITNDSERTVTSQTNYFLNAPLEEHYARLERLGLPAPGSDGRKGSCPSRPRRR
jgi:hypothetical protein